MMLPLIFKEGKPWVLLENLVVENPRYVEL